MGSEQRFYEALRALGRAPVDPGAGLALHRGVFVGGSPERWVQSVQLAAHLGCSTGQSVHVMTTDRSTALVFYRESLPLFTELGWSSALRRSFSDVDERRSHYGCDVVVGDRQQICVDFLRDNLARVPEEAVGIPANRLLVPDGTEILLRAGTELVQLSDPASGEVAARIPIRDRVLGYRTVGGVLAGGALERAELEEDYGRSTVVFGRAGRPSRPSKHSVPSRREAYFLADIERPQRENHYRVRNHILHADDLGAVVGSQFDRCLAEDDVRDAYRLRSGQYPPPARVAFERKVLITVLDLQWIRHLSRLDAEAGSEDFRAAAERSQELLLDDIARDVVGYLLHASPGPTTGPGEGER